MSWDLSGNEGGDWTRVMRIRRAAEDSYSAADGIPESGVHDSSIFFCRGWSDEDETKKELEAH